MLLFGDESAPHEYPLREPEPVASNVSTDLTAVTSAIGLGATKTVCCICTG